MGSAIASPSTTPVAFVGRPRGPPRCKSAPLYHRAQVARPISQGLQGGETPFCARLRPVAPSCAWLRSPAPFCALLRPSAPFCALLRPSAPGLRPVALSRTVLRPSAPFCALLRPVALSRTVLRPSAPFCAVAPRPLHAPAPSHPGPSRHFFNRCHYFSRRHLARKPTLIQPCSLRGNRLKSTTGQSLLTRCFFFRVVRV